MNLIEEATYWEDTVDQVIEGTHSIPRKGGGIAIIGSGLAGVSVAYFLLGKGFDDITIIDCGTRNASWFRNAGHMMFGTGESYIRMKALHGDKKAKELMLLSKDFLKTMGQTWERLGIEKEVTLYSGMYKFAASKEEAEELRDSNRYLAHDELICIVNNLGDKAPHIVKDGAYNRVFRCNESYHSNPARFRNALMKHILPEIKYYSYPVSDVIQNGNICKIYFSNDAVVEYDSVVLCGNVYNNLISEDFKDSGLIEPFKGQIIVSEPIDIPEMYQFAFTADHGYIYGKITDDDRLLIGGWRNNVPGGEIGSYSLDVNKSVEDGLKEYAHTHFHLPPDLKWEYSWSGIMGTAKGGIPFVGPTQDNLIYTCSGFTGYGFGWAHGSACLLANIMAGDELPDGWEHFNPRR